MEQDRFDAWLDSLGELFGTVLLILVRALLLWVLWPLVVPTIFPGAVRSGALALSLGPVQAVWLSLFLACVLSHGRRRIVSDDPKGGSS